MTITITINTLFIIMHLLSIIIQHPKKSPGTVLGGGRMNIDKSCPDMVEHHQKCQNNTSNKKIEKPFLLISSNMYD